MHYRAIDFDFSRPDLSFLSDYDDSLIFTSWGAICAQHFDASFFEAIKALPGSVTLVFIEPLGFQVSCDCDQSLDQARGAHAKGYNLNFFSELREACGDGRIEIASIVKDIFAPSELVSELVTIIIALKPAV